MKNDVIALSYIVAFVIPHFDLSITFDVAYTICSEGHGSLDYNLLYLL